MDFKKNQKLMIESVNDLSLSLCLHVDTAYRNGKKVYRTKVGKRTASSGSFCCFLGFLDFLKHLIKFNNDMFNSV